MKKGIKPPNYIQYLDFSIIKKSKISNNLKNFIYEGTFFRITILGTIIYAIKNIKKGSFILDVGAGDSPYKELFTNYKYKSTDFSNTKYHKYKNIDYICSTDNIPIKDSTVDAIICTEVIEHVQNIKTTIKEFNRLLRKKGDLFITVPFIIGEHEIPYDNARYTQFYLKNIIEKSGFKLIFITPRGGIIASIGNIILSLQIKPQNMKKNKLLYIFIYIPFFIFPKIILYLFPREMISSLDRIFDTKQVWTPGYAIHAQKI